MSVQEFLAKGEDLVSPSPLVSYQTARAETFVHTYPPHPVLLSLSTQKLYNT